MSGADRLHPSPGTAVLRRYRTGSEGAECWLLAVAAGEQPRYCVLDDRTLLAATPPPEGPAVAAHLLAATGGRIDLLAATVLGAPPSVREPLAGLEVAELWLPWTEDPADPAARRLRRDHAAGAATLRRAADRLDQLGTETATTGGAPSAERLRQVASALPAVPPANPACGQEAGAGAHDREGGADGGGSGSTARGAADRTEPDRTALLAALAGRVRYLGAGDVSDDPLLPGLRLHVLAPSGEDPSLAPASAAPADDRLRRGPAIAEPAPRFSPGASLFAAALTDPIGLPLAPEDRALQQLDRPFDLVYALPYEAATADPDWGSFFHAHYGFTKSADDGPGWRRIDADWLGTAARLAFQLDAEREAATLALVVEIGTPARNLVFPPTARAHDPQRTRLPLPPLADAPWTDHALSLA